MPQNANVDEFVSIHNNSISGQKKNRYIFIDIKLQKLSLTEIEQNARARRQLYSRITNKKKIAD